MAVDVNYIITIVQFVLMLLFVYIAFKKYLTNKFEGKRDRVRLLLFLAFLSFFVVSAYNLYMSIQGLRPSSAFGFQMRNWSQVLFYMMMFEVLDIKYPYYSVILVNIYVQIFFPEYLDQLSTITGTVSMILMFVIGKKYRAGKITGLGVMGILGFIIIFGRISGNIIIIILAYAINDVYKLLYISDKINFYSPDKEEKKKAKKEMKKAKKEMKKLEKTNQAQVINQEVKD